MKIIYSKNLLKTCIGVFLSFHYITPTYVDYFCHNPRFSYKENCSFINIAEKVRYITDIFYYRARYKKSELYHALFTIKEQLHHFEKELLLLEQKVLYEIKQKYNLSDELWSQCLADIESTKQNYAQGLLESSSITKWDPSITDIKEILIPLLRENNINPESINVILAERESIDFPGRLAQTLLEVNIQKGDNFIIKNEYIPATITIFPSLLTQTFEEKMSICAHEVQHLALQHSVTIIVLIEYLSHYMDITQKDFRQSKECNDLIQIHEAQAEVMAAIKNPMVSRCLASFRGQHYYPGYLYEKHFCQLAAIDTLWKIHNKLENLYFTRGN